MTGDNLIFAGGAPRSGLTLLRAITSAHPQIFCGPDSGVTPSLPMQWRTIATQLGDLHRRDFGLSPKAVRTNFAYAIDCLLTMPLSLNGKHAVLEKNPLNVLAFESLAEIFPQAKFIHVVRDGRDVVTSLLERDWRDPQSGQSFPHVRDTAAAAAYWNGVANTGLRAGQIINDPRRFFVLHYESLASEPKYTLQELFDFLRLPFDNAVLAFHEALPPLMGIEKESIERLCRPISDDRVGRWRNQLSAEQQRTVENIAAPSLKSLGYFE